MGSGYSIIILKGAFVMCSMSRWGSDDGYVLGDNKKKLKENFKKLREGYKGRMRPDRFTLYYASFLIFVFVLFSLLFALGVFS